MKKEIKNVCYECGVSANVLTCLDRFGRRPDKIAYSISTFHKGICDVCGEMKYVTEQRDFFYPNFELLEKVALFLKTTERVNLFHD